MLLSLLQLVCQNAISKNNHQYKRGQIKVYIPRFESRQLFHPKIVLLTSKHVGRKVLKLHVLTSGVAEINLVRSFGELLLLFKMIKNIYLILVNNGAIDRVWRVMNDSFRSVSTLKTSLKSRKHTPVRSCR